MECHAVLFHVPFAKQGELVVAFLLAFAFHGLPDSHQLCHQKHHHRCFVQNLKHYCIIALSMKRSQLTRHFRLHLLIQMIQLRFRTFPRCLNLLRLQNHSRSFIELPGFQIFDSSLTFFQYCRTRLTPSNNMTKTKWRKVTGEATVKKPRMHIWKTGN